MSWSFNYQDVMSWKFISMEHNQDEYSMKVHMIFHLDLDFVLRTTESLSTTSNYIGVVTIANTTTHFM